MESGSCYVIATDELLYEFPDYSCSDGDVLSLSSSERVFVHQVFNGRIFKVRETNSDFLSIESGSVVHVWSSNGFYSLDMNYILLPATLFIICLFTVLFRWFIRLRG